MRERGTYKERCRERGGERVKRDREKQRDIDRHIEIGPEMQIETHTHIRTHRDGEIDMRRETEIKDRERERQ